MANNNSIILLDVVPGMRKEGDVVAGFVRVNPTLAMEKDVTSVRVSLKGEMHTWITVSTGQSTTVYRGKEILLNIEQVLWTPDSAVQPLSSGFANLPFSINIPDSSNSTRRLPASFHCGTSHTGARVQYYIHAVAVRKAWYQRNTRLNFAFPFVPLDTTQAPFIDFRNWSGGWNISRHTVDMRSNIIKIFSSPGSVECQLLLPTTPTIPLFKPIPLRLVVICKSKLMPTASSQDPSTFEFPRIPKLTDTDLSVVIFSHIKARSLKRNLTTNLGLIGGFGEPDDRNLLIRGRWGSDVLTEATAPQWLPDYEKSDKGRWTETVTFSCNIVFRCPTPIESHLINTTVNLDVKIDFPGLGNNLKMVVGPLALSSGRVPSQFEESNPVNLDLPPSYWDVVEVDEKGGDEKK